MDNLSKASTSDSVMVPLERIPTDDGVQTRVKVRDNLVRAYAASMQQQLDEGYLRFPPVILFLEGTTYWLADGFHRVRAARRLGLAEIVAHVHPGTRRDALLFGISANTAHGLPRTAADKRKAVDLLLRDPEWGQWSDREIAKRCLVGHSFVSNMRRGASVHGGQITRKVARGGTVYEMTQKATPNTPAPPVPAVDPAGAPLREPLASVFAALGDFQEAEELLDRLAVVLDRIAQGPAGEVLRADMIRAEQNGKTHFACELVRSWRNRLHVAKPYCSYCPACQRTHPVRAYAHCKTCGGRGWTSRPAFDRCAPSDRAEVLKLPMPG